MYIYFGEYEKMEETASEKMKCKLDISFKIHMMERDTKS